MIPQFSRFVKSGAGLEKTLRLIQCVSQVVAALTVSSALAMQLTTVKLQLALARRYFRFFGFIDSFQRMLALLGKDGFSSVAGMLELAKCTCFGLYFVLEDLTTLHAMGVYAVSWNGRVMDQANTFWFYALSFSVAGAIWALLAGSEQPLKKNGKRKNQKTTSEKATPVKVTATSTRVKQIVVDGCDLLIPLELLGWMPTGDVVVGSTMVLSTLLTAQDIWARDKSPKKMDLQGIEPWTTPMLREYYTTKPQAQLDERHGRLVSEEWI
ncbi:peroxin-11B Pex11B-Penicillium chrysogenum [Penicillium robsamsonii]|uniref:peroxin-11B Pex11B-Penicillium chrysogenum n=1 Tax=Penicillium robsamsonii TaxID=1792511 RepID=UPI0025481F28|nr:peroxin-11B Pex11B-Penicillium chrysogenum [Penicillium robsamsonii]KAJ5822386.1 peroxin-11B Pex11B-Penicillium chrysogenum [Penicillium robsamsonii]